MDPIILLLLLTLIFSPSVALLNYTQPCPDPNDAANVCDFRKGLTCNTDVGSCMCRNQPEDMVYDVERDTCIALLGGDCSGVLFEFPQLPCERGTWCRYQGTGISHCFCDSTTSPGPNRTCLKSYFASCSQDSDCNPHDLLECKANRCLCPKSSISNFFDYNSNICRAKIGQPCDPRADPTKTLGCIPSGLCVTEASSPTGFRCGCNSTSVPSSYLENCFPTYNQKCFGSCADQANLGCIDGTCQCAYAEQVWDSAKKSCVAVEGDLCTTEVGTGATRQLCQSGLKCVGPAPYTNGVLGVCTALPNEETTTLSTIPPTASPTALPTRPPTDPPITPPSTPPPTSVTSPTTTEDPGPSSACTLIIQGTLVMATFALNLLLT